MAWTMIFNLIAYVTSIKTQWMPMEKHLPKDMK